MTPLRYVRLCAMLLLLAPALGRTTQAAVPAGRLALLRHGLNMVHWFRYPADPHPAALARGVPRATLERIHAAGFDFLRLPVQPHLVAGEAGRRALASAIRRILGAGFAVVVVPADPRWRLNDPGFDARLIARFWRRIAPVLARFGPARVFPEIDNEPILTDRAAWPPMQARLLALIRHDLPADTVIATGGAFGGVDGLLRLKKLADSDVIYAFHFYEPSLLTALGAFDPALDHTALARLPFPVRTPRRCAAQAIRPGTDARTRAVIRYYCAAHATAATLKARVDGVARWAQGAPVIVGEFGASVALDGPARLAWLAAARRAFEADGFGWALWAWRDPMGLPAGLDPATLRALGLPPAEGRR